MIKYQISQLRIHFHQYQGTITAFSGGVDSALVLYLSRWFLGKQNAIGVISNSQSLKSSDYQLAIDFAKKFDIVLETVHTRELLDENYYANPSNRCYYCKAHLYRTLKEVQKKYPGFVVLNGTNKDDASDYRPGTIAAEEHDIRSPLAELKLGKADIRAMARHIGLPLWNKPASPCLSSRIPYGKVVTAQKLQQIEKAEGILFDLGFKEVRVRHYEEDCKIEVPLSQLEDLKNKSEMILASFKELGFKHCLIDQEGLISGKLNRALLHV